jgi:metal-responsive CopG/Arc/MetJ family transcriptional regulator
MSNSKSLNVRIPADMHQALVTAQEQRRLDSRSAMVRLIIADWLDLERFLQEGNGGKYSVLYNRGIITLEEAMRLSSSPPLTDEG